METYSYGNIKYMTKEEMDTFNKYLVPILSSIFEDMLIMVVCMQISVQEDTSDISHPNCVFFTSYVIDEDGYASVANFKFNIKYKSLRLDAKKSILKYVTKDNMKKLEDLIRKFYRVLGEDPTIPVINRISVSNYWVGNSNTRLTIGLMTETIENGQIRYAKKPSGLYVCDENGNKVPVYDVHLGGTRFGIQEEYEIEPNFPTIARFDKKFAKFVPNDIEFDD